MSICQNNHLHETPRTWFKAEQRHVLYYICLPLFTRRARFEFIVWHLLSKCVQCSCKGNSTLWKTRRLWYHATIGNAHFAALASKNWFAFLFSSSSSSLSLEFTELLDLRLSRTRFLGSISSKTPWNTCPAKATPLPNHSIISELEFLWATNSLAHTQFSTIAELQALCWVAIPVRTARRPTRKKECDVKAETQMLIP